MDSDTTPTSRKCACGRFMCPDSSLDDHDSCSKCRGFPQGKDCTKEQTCAVCFFWDESRWAKVLDYRNRTVISTTLRRLRRTAVAQKRNVQKSFSFGDSDFTTRNMSTSSSSSPPARYLFSTPAPAQKEPATPCPSVTSPPPTPAYEVRARGHDAQLRSIRSSLDLIVGHLTP